MLRQRYRLVVLSDTTFGEKISIRLSPWGIIIGTAAIIIVLTSINISLVAFTPLREYIPGYGDVSERKEILQLSIKADSIEQTLEVRDQYITSVLNVFNEKVEAKTGKPGKDTTGKYAHVNIKPSSNDIEFRREYELKQGKSEASVAKLIYAGLGEVVFFSPVRGMITNSYDVTEEHFGVDIVTKEDETIKSTLDGTVIFTGFSAEDGNVIHVQHANNSVSIYKHCSAILKTVGTRVKSGEVIAVVGNTGEKSNGPHLHFELWYNGSSVNPAEFVVF
ncbi:MAG: M23 family metallopeptidase [bacterium]|nr:M23 family metallopeptidase [bacterium]